MNGTSDGSDAAAAVVVDASGDVIAGGRLRDAGASDDFAVLKLAGANGGEIWRRIVNSGNLIDECRSLAVAANGDVLAAGVLTPPGSAAVANVIRIDAATGLRLWTHALGSSGVGGPAVTRDAAGDVVAVASIAGPNGSDAVVFELNGSNGSEIWHRAIDGTLAGSGDRGVAVTVDGSGDVVIGGLTANVGTNQDLMVAKVSGASGGDFPCGNGAVDGGEACDDGNVDACDGCSPTCTAEIPNVCGDGILNDLCGEQCDDGDQQNGDGCNDACKIELLDDAHRHCQEGIARAGAGFAASVLKAVQGCRDRINAGRLTTVFEQCPSEPQTASTITRAETQDPAKDRCQMRRRRGRRSVALRSDGRWCSSERHRRDACWRSIVRRSTRSCSPNTAADRDWSCHATSAGAPPSSRGGSRSGPRQDRARP